MEKERGITITHKDGNNANTVLATVGCRYIIDNGFRNSGVVELVAIYGKHFCRVKDPDNGAEWDTMLNRLSDCG